MLNPCPKNLAWVGKQLVCFTVYLQSMHRHIYIHIWYPRTSDTKVLQTHEKGRYWGGAHHIYIYLQYVYICIDSTSIYMYKRIESSFIGSKMWARKYEKHVWQAKLVEKQQLTCCQISCGPPLVGCMWGQWRSQCRSEKKKLNYTNKLKDCKKEVERQQRPKQ